MFLRFQIADNNDAGRKLLEDLQMFYLENWRLSREFLKLRQSTSGRPKKREGRGAKKTPCCSKFKLNRREDHVSTNVESGTISLLFIF